MPGRLDPRPLVRDLLQGLRLREHAEPEPPDVVTRIVLWGTPIIVGIAIGVCDLQLRDIGQLLSAVALFLGVLVAAFTQVASWRERILSRGRRIDDIDVRSLNEAGAHILISVLAALAIATLILVLINLPSGHNLIWLQVIARFLRGCCAAGFTYMGLTLVVVVNLLRDAYLNEEREARRERLKDP